MPPLPPTLVAAIKPKAKIGISASLSPAFQSQVLYMDRALLVMQKPPGLISQGDSTESEAYRKGESLNRVLEDIQNRYSIENPLYPVHRLDKGTTGALLVARTAQAARDISKQLLTRDVQKTYLALVRGGEKTFRGRSGTIRQKLSVHEGRVSVASPRATPNRLKSQSADADQSEDPWTEWELLASSPDVPISLLRLKLHTGHKHQLRVHLASTLGAPILGDTVHSKSALPLSITEHVTIPAQRLFLHASYVELWRFRKTGASKRFRLGISAPLPRDFLRLCQRLHISLDHASPEVNGGVFIDGQKVKEGELEGVDGKWLP